MSNLKSPSFKKHSKNKIWLFLRLFLIFGILWFGIMFRTPVHAQDEEIVLEVLPEKIELFPGREAEIHVTIRNLSKNEIQDVSLSSFNDLGLEIVQEGLKKTDVAPYGTLTWVLRFTQAGIERLNGRIYLQAEYSWQPENSEGSINGVVNYSLEVYTIIPEAISVKPSIQIETSLTNLVEGQSGIIYVIVNNPSNLPIHLNKIEADGPDFFEF